VFILFLKVDIGKLILNLGFMNIILKHILALCQNDICKLSERITFSEFPEGAKTSFTGSIVVQ
jgi:hypothetical protein